LASDAVHWSNWMVLVQYYTGRSQIKNTA